MSAAPHQEAMGTNTLVICPKCEKLNRVALAAALKASPICGNCKTSLPLHGGVQDLSGSALIKLVKLADRPLIVDFWAEWCGPCRVFAPTFQSAAVTFGGRFIFAKLNTEKSPDAAQKFQIRGIPTLIVFKKGLEVDRQSGAMSLVPFLEYLNRWKKGEDL